MKGVSFILLAFAATAFAEPANNPVHAIHYEVEVRPDFQGHSLTGETFLRFESLSDGLDHLTFSVHELKVSSLLVGNKVSPFVLSQGNLTIPLEKSLKRGDVSAIRVRYQGSPTSGVVFGEHSIYTAYDTCQWMICDQDNPGDKATLELKIDLPKDLTLIASGHEIGQRTLPDGWVRHIWREGRPYSAYVFGFAAGKFNIGHSSIKKTGLDFYSEFVASPVMSQIFQDTGRMITFFEEKSGVPFPNPRYSQVIVPGDEAQEVSSFSVIGNENLDPILKDAKEDWAIVHELAHEWWGNFITCASWDHFWLNEGLVVFMTAAYKEVRWGKAEYDREMDVARKRYQVAKDAGFDVPLTRAQSLPSLKYRRAIAYSKAALFLDSLRKQMGETRFWSGIKEYSIQFAGKTVTSRDFEKVMVLHGDADTSKLFQAWVF